VNAVMLAPVNTATGRRNIGSKDSKQDRVRDHMKAVCGRLWLVLHRLRGFGARCFMSLPYAQDTGGENPYIDTKDVLKLLIVGDSAVRLLITLGARSAW
jgi:hypothetical protein